MLDIDQMKKVVDLINSMNEEQVLKTLHYCENKLEQG